MDAGMRAKISQRRPDPALGRKTGAIVRVMVALLATLPASCTTIGPSAALASGLGKSADAFALDRTACMAETDAALRPMAIRLNLVIRGPDEVAADN